jgi:proteasome accessory factor C
MADNAAAQLRRVLTVLPQLADGEEHSIAEVARRAGVDEQTIRDDLRALVSREDEPGGFVDGVQLYLEGETVSLVSGEFRRPMRLTTSELCAVELGLAMLASERPPDEQRSIESARERLRRVIARLPSESLPDPTRHASIGADVGVEHLSAIRKALRGRRKLAIDYRSARATDTVERVVCPYAVAVVSGMFYLVAFCEASRGLRIFRVDRIERSELLSETFPLPAGFSVEKVIREGKVMYADAPVEEATVRYSPRVARWISEREGCGISGDGSVTMSRMVADPEWLIGHVLQYGPDAEVLEPKEMRQLVADRLAAIRTGG